MISSRAFHLAALACCTALPLASQGPLVGTVTVNTHITIPDSLRSKAPIGDAVDLQVTVMSDGHRYAADLGTMTTIAGLPPMHLHFVFATMNDTLNFGVVLPSELAALAGGAPGFRIDIPRRMVDSLAGAVHGAIGKVLDSMGSKLVDSIRKAMPQVTYRSLNRSSTVGGMSCEEWQTIARADTVNLCLIPTPPAIVAMKQHVLDMLTSQQSLKDLVAIVDAGRQAMGGRDMMAIRTEYTKMGMRMELASYTAGVPAASQFDIPANLQVVPLPALPAINH